MTRYLSQACNALLLALFCTWLAVTKLGLPWGEVLR